MTLEPPILEPPAAATHLEVYLLGTVGYEAALGLQRRLVFQVSGDRSGAALFLCEHPPLITVGRHGGWRQLACGPGDLRRERWSIRWVNRGGGAWLHLPGQLAIYPVLPLDRLELGVCSYLSRLQRVLLDLLEDFSIHGEAPAGTAGIHVAGRSIAEVGVAVRDWVSYYGAVLNVCPDLKPYRLLDRDTAPTSLARERRGPLRPSLVRERLIEHFQARFGFGRVSLFFEHPALGRKAPSDAVAASS